MPAGNSDTLLNDSGVNRPSAGISSQVINTETMVKTCLAGKREGGEFKWVRDY
jgi:hypothetical protein